jgi:hypothetical protein
MVNAVSYACASRIHGQSCSNDAYLHREVIEAGLLAGIKQRVLSPAAIEEVRARVAKLAKSKPTPDSANALAKASAEVANLTEAIARGALRTSPAIAKRLGIVEREVQRLKAARA